MGAILNGLCAHGALLPYGATFLTFSDYMRPAIRLGSLMRAHVIYVFTHDSIGLGEDGPTHQPVEHLAALRAIPRVWVIRPCDANETVEAWRVAAEARDRPVALVLTRQSVPILDRSVFAPAAGLRQGAYILADPEQGEPDLILIASGSEVSLIVEAREALQRQGVKVRLVSMPCWELFDAQRPDYRERVLPAAKTARVVVEAGASLGWHRFAGPRGGVIALDRFGESAPGAVVMRELGFTTERICACARGVLENGHAPLET
jgi:transketolase